MWTARYLAQFTEDMKTGPYILGRASEAEWWIWCPASVPDPPLPKFERRLATPEENELIRRYGPESSKEAWTIMTDALGPKRKSAAEIGNNDPLQTIRAAWKAVNLHPGITIQTEGEDAAEAWRKLCAAFGTV